MRYLLIVCLAFTQLNAGAQTPAYKDGARIYLVRHAEKQNGKDPLLTDEGNKRSGDLARALKGQRIQRIYVTEYKRTQHTADSLMIHSGIDTVHYLSDTSCTDLMNKIIANNDLDNTIVIIGHSNTLPLIIGKLGIAGYPATYIPDSEFDNLFLLTFKKGKASLKKTKFGAPSATSAKMQ